MILELLKAMILFSGDIFPVNREIFFLSTSRNISQEALCCATNGLVGANIIVFALPLYFSRALAINKIPIIVFPSPVGRTTKLFFALHFFTILS